MLAKLKHNVDEDIQTLLPEAIEIAKSKKREIIKEASGLAPVSGGRNPGSVNRSSFSKGGIYHMGSNKGYGSPGYLGNTYNDTRSYEPTNRGRNINKKGPYEI